MSEKKVVKRSVTIVLGIICIILVAGLVGGLGYFMLVMHDKDNMISSLNSQVSQLNINATNLQKIANLTESKVIVQNYFAGPNALNSSTVVVSNNTVLPSSMVEIFRENGSAKPQPHIDHVDIDYAGYIVVDVYDPFSFVELEYSSNGISYNNTVNCGNNTAGGSAYFPVLPTSTLTIQVGVSNIYSPIDFEIGVPAYTWETVTITYYY